MTTDTAIAELLSAYKALFAFQKYRVNRLNLRLGLHSKRYAVFKKFLVFIKVICESSWGRNGLSTKVIKVLAKSEMLTQK